MNIDEEAAKVIRQLDECIECDGNWDTEERAARDRLFSTKGHPMTLVKYNFITSSLDFQGRAIGYLLESQNGHWCLASDVDKVLEEKETEIQRWIHHIATKNIQMVDLQSKLARVTAELEKAKSYRRNVWVDPAGAEP